LAGLVTQRRRPLSPATISAFTSYVRRLVPMIGADTPLTDINSGTLRDLVTQLITEELSAKTIGELVVTVKQFVASAMDGNGDPIFPRQWNKLAHRSNLASCVKTWSVASRTPPMNRSVCFTQCWREAGYAYLSVWQFMWQIDRRLISVPGDLEGTTAGQTPYSQIE
jgi:hypothetical protein